MPRPIGPDGLPLTADEFRALLREEAGYIARVPRTKLPAYGLRDSRRGRRRGLKPRRPDPAPLYAAEDGNCCIYVVGTRGHPVKVGMARDVAQRVRVLQTGFPHRLRIFGAVEVPAAEAREIERECHRKLRAKRLSGEWFDVSPRDALNVVTLTVETW